MFSVKSGEWERILGDYLSDPTNEFEWNNITKFVTDGTKGMHMSINREKMKTCTYCEIRGITLNLKNKQMIYFDTVVNMIQGPAQQKMTVVGIKISRDPKNTRIVIKQKSKDFRIVFDKRVLIDNYISFPYVM